MKKKEKRNFSGDWEKWIFECVFKVNLHSNQRAVLSDKNVRKKAEYKCRARKFMYADSDRKTDIEAERERESEQ